MRAKCVKLILASETLKQELQYIPERDFTQIAGVNCDRNILYWYDYVGQTIFKIAVDQSVDFDFTQRNVRYRAILQRLESWSDRPVQVVIGQDLFTIHSNT